MKPLEAWRLHDTCDQLTLWARNRLSVDCQNYLASRIHGLPLGRIEDQMRRSQHPRRTSRGPPRLSPSLYPITEVFLGREVHDITVAHKLKEDLKEVYLRLNMDLEDQYKFVKQTHPSEGESE
jgi:hypothetical protein